MKSFLLFTPPVLGVFALVSCFSRHAGDGVARAPSPTSEPMQVASASDRAGGRALFLKNCAHCHGADAHGDEGPDLHNLDWTDEQIATRIRNGKKGQMTAFAGKLSAGQINEIIAYLRTLK
jgi:mono/diheme cytochrome c family protein